ncbi:HDR159Cp [Eremothecium sinecaudum]|uniref:HDR159Cp n=1 Tax=Eremothecium sinecaudum TaxID=45286 RepID=A0A0X8HSZ7_9SACH|nr:HDR159Cp [Eremothecium sinecaudum]AMD20901.1 HDR159Cp [Eremothecium sinecaudum]
MSLGTLYSKAHSRGRVPAAIIDVHNLDVKIVEPDSSPEFQKLFPLNKIPGFVNAKGQAIHETMAITYYLINFIEDEQARNRLLGADIDEQAQVMKWFSLVNADYLEGVKNVFLVIIGKMPYVKQIYDYNVDATEKITNVIEDRLTNYTYLATENISVADIIFGFAIAMGVETHLGKKWRDEHPAIMRWFNTMLATDYFKGVELKYIDNPPSFQPPKKQKKEKKEKEEPKEQAPAKAKEQEAPAAAEAAPAKKPKHPLAALGNSTFDLEDWKRKYSNEDTRSVAMPWFWENYNPEEYSIWKVAYKYNDELTLTFMSNNLIGGFFNRLSASVKYMFGSLVVYGENNANGIIGAVMVRGQDHVPAFDVAPDWESYDFTKLDPSKEEDKEFINNMWAWDKPVVVNGESKEIADGKVLK